jgi:cysteine desulfurase/selenocysteine lyase
MTCVGHHTRVLTQRALDGVRAIEGSRVYGPAEVAERSPLVAFTVAGTQPAELAARLDELGVEARAGCHCATLAHRELGLTPAGSCRLSFALYTSTDDVDRALEALRRAVTELRSSQVSRHA